MCAVGLYPMRLEKAAQYSWWWAWLLAYLILPYLWGVVTERPARGMTILVV